MDRPRTTVARRQWCDGERHSCPPGCRPRVITSAAGENQGTSKTFTPPWAGREKPTATPWPSNSGCWRLRYAALAQDIRIPVRSKCSAVVVHGYPLSTRERISVALTSRAEAFFSGHRNRRRHIFPGKGRLVHSWSLSFSCPLRPTLVAYEVWTAACHRRPNSSLPTPSQAGCFRQRKPPLTPPSNRCAKELRRSRWSLTNTWKKSSRQLKNPGLACQRP